MWNMICLIISYAHGTCNNSNFEFSSTYQIPNQAHQYYLKINVQFNVCKMCAERKQKQCSLMLNSHAISHCPVHLNIPMLNTSHVL